MEMVSVKSTWLERTRQSWKVRAYRGTTVLGVCAWVAMLARGSPSMGRLELGVTLFAVVSIVR